MSVEERIRLIRLIDKIDKEPDYCRRLGVVNVSRFKTGDSPQMIKADRDM